MRGSEETETPEQIHSARLFIPGKAYGRDNESRDATLQYFCFT